jgi:hypothetical protein
MERVMQTKLIAAALLLSTLGSVTLATSADAHQRWRYAVDKREAKQHYLIHQGRRSGALTWRETVMLRREQVRIARMERAFRADGHLSWSERQALRYAQDAASSHIFHERNDREGRHYWR